MEFDFDARELPLFPLNAVLFPGGLLGLKVFEARYLDLVTTCLRERQPFGIVALRTGSDVRRSAEAVTFENIGTLAELISADSEQTGILQVRCSGLQRFSVVSSRQREDGLWLARADAVDDDEAVAP
jgi:Lon protease-like protein